MSSYLHNTIKNTTCYIFYWYIPIILKGLYFLVILSYGWGEKGEEGSSEDPGNIFYRGPRPFSEPETAAVQVSGYFFEFCSIYIFFNFNNFAWNNEEEMKETDKMYNYESLYVNIIINIIKQCWQLFSKTTTILV